MAQQQDQAKKRASYIIFKAINSGNLEPVIKLVQNGFAINDAIMECGINLVMHAASSDKCDPQQFGTLLTLSPDLNATDNIGRTPLHFACRAGNLSVFK